MKKAYIVLALEAKRPVNVFAIEKELHCSWADGMVGVCPVFGSKTKAKKYAGKKATVLEIEY